MAERIKVMHLVTRMNVGGVAVLLDNLMSYIDKGQFHARLVMGACELPEGEYLEGRTTEYEVVRIESFHKSLKFKDDFVSFVSICKHLREFKPDVIHTHTSKAGLFGRIAASIVLPKAKVVHTFHGHLLVGYFNPIKLKIVKTIEKTLGLLSNTLIAMGTQVMEDLVRVGIAPRAKFKVFFPGLTKPIFPEKIAAREALGLETNRTYCVFIGRLTQIKRPDRILEIAAITMRDDQDVEFLIVGDGELASDLKTRALAANLPVTFLGWRQDIPAILKASDIALLTSDNEAVALTLIEATQAGLPIVTTAAGSVRDVAVNGENGYVLGFESQEMADAILKLVRNPELREEFGQAGMRRSETLFSIEKMVSDHERLYLELLSN
jgi:glycosyltransferase involved in cell wall biosynthesis